MDCLITISFLIFTFYENMKLKNHFVITSVYKFWKLKTKKSVNFFSFQILENWNGPIINTISFGVKVLGPARLMF